jgi:catecholate siderophore receptor
LTDNFRNTGYFNNTATSILVPFANPLVTVPATFRQSATDADNHLRATVAAVYAQDQIEFSERVLLLTGLRFDRFDLEYRQPANRGNTRAARQSAVAAHWTGRQTNDAGVGL